MCKSCTCRSKKNIERQAIKDYAEYLECRELFEKNKGIIQPIRATVKVYERANTTLHEVIEDAMNCMNTTCMPLSGEAGEAIQIKTFEDDTTTVGYLSARALSKVAIGFGCSFCRPCDYLNFQKWRGMLLAMPSRIHVDSCESQNISCAISLKLAEEYGFGDKFLSVPYLNRHELHHYLVDISEDGSYFVVYYFPITLEEQLKHFMNRCRRYFKKTASGSKRKNGVK